MRRRQWHPTPVLLPGKSHGQRSLVGCSPCGRTELDTTERLPFHFSLSCIGEGNGNPLQCFCLENPRDGRAWWAAVYGVAQSRTQLKRLSSSSNESVLRIRWPKYWSFSFSISPSNEYSGLSSFRMDWLYLLAVQGTLKSLLQHQINFWIDSKASILPRSASFIAQLSHPYMTTGKTIALTRQTFVIKVITLLCTYKYC